MRIFVWVWLGCSVLFTSAQAQEPKAAAWLAEINRDVWLPFMEGVNKDQESLYLGVRSADYIRVQAGSKLILTYPQYVDDTVNMMRNYRERGTKLTLSVRFEERILNGGSASEKGISRVLFATKDGEPRTFYSRFHTISRKEDGRWRVLSEYFPETEPGLGEQQFMAAKPPEDVGSFLCYMLYPEKKARCD